MRQSLSFSLILITAWIAAAGQQPAAQPPVSPPAVAASTITGTVKSGDTPLPGVAISATNTLTGKKVFTTTAVDGAFRMTIPGRGRWVVRAELPAFAPETKEIVFTPELLGTTQRADIALVLASR